MDLEKMLEILFKKCKDYKRTNEEIIKTLDIPHTKLMKDYMRQINDDPVLWFEAFPNEYTSIEALAKPKSGMIYLLEKNDEVRKELGTEFCDNLAKQLHTIWKKLKNNLLESRVLPIQVTKIEERDDKLNEDLETLQKENDELKLRLEKNDVNTSSLISQIEKLKLRLDKNELDKNELVSKVEKLKLLFIDTLRGKCIDESDLKIYIVLLSMW
jgi:chromosome segregation ATPase